MLRQLEGISAGFNALQDLNHKVTIRWGDPEEQHFTLTKIHSLIEFPPYGASSSKHYRDQVTELVSDSLLNLQFHVSKEIDRCLLVDKPVADFHTIESILAECNPRTILERAPVQMEQVERLLRPHVHGIRADVRWMIRSDMGGLLTAEKECEEFAWTEEDFLRCLRQRNCVGFVAEIDNTVAGYQIYELHKQKLHILKFGVLPGLHRRLVGTQMIMKLISKLSSHRRSRVTLEIRESNLGAQLFFRDLDFKAVRVMRNFYEDTGEDSFLMQYRVDDEGPEPVDVAEEEHADEEE